MMMAGWGEGKEFPHHISKRVVFEENGTSSFVWFRKI
jgi:hypothetical protein